MKDDLSKEILVGLRKIIQAIDLHSRFLVQHFLPVNSQAGEQRRAAEQ